MHTAPRQLPDEPNLLSLGGVDAGWGGGVVVLVVVVEGEGDMGCVPTSTVPHRKSIVIDIPTSPRRTLTDMSERCFESYLNIHLIFLHAYYV